MRERWHREAEKSKREKKEYGKVEKLEMVKHKRSG